ncbi:MAG: SusC/RagA family TonB-linked outer membrane protein [Bacteroidales bacterium]|nr:SusC/RagA family TonB-linked outer membrane protein [Bacteroidales bacterium]MBR0500223.1 SusC/RagA family TonB-linked outer membrane protein [Bacteroidales bacterium]
MKRLIFLFALLLTAMQLNAQIAVKGTVTASDTGEPMIGASVMEKGTMNGTVTGIDGTYALTVTDGSAVLVISTIGFKTVEIPVSNRALINVALDVDQQLLDELVVVGYSSKTRAEITSAVAVVGAEKLNDVVTSDITHMLQGKVAGVSVINSSGLPGSSASIRIRGTSSLNAPQEPLYVVDGIIGGSYDPNDVESVTVLKDAGSTGMYGAQANGGVIVVTTKKAKGDQLQFNFKSTVGMAQADFSRQRLMNSRQLYQYYREYYRDPETGLVDDVAFQSVAPKSVMDTDTDWRGLVYRNALLHSHHLSVAGRTAKNSFYNSVSYYDEQGTLKYTGYKKINVRSNNTMYLTKWLTVTNNLNVWADKQDQPDDLLVYYVLQGVVWDSPYDSEGNLVPFTGRTDLYSRYDKNPMIGYSDRNKDSRTSKSFGVDYDFVLTAQITPWLSFVSQTRASAGAATFDYHRTADVEYMQPGDQVEGEQSLDYGGISTNMFKVQKDWGKHSFDALVGYEAQRSWWQNVYGEGKGLPYGLYVLSVASDSKDVAGTQSVTGMQSFISQAAYNYASKYFINASFRIDQSSTFNKQNRTAMFPSVSAAWVVSNEEFFNSSAITNLKFKVSWGKTGMKDIGASKYLEAFSYSTQYDNHSAATATQMANANLKWEQTDQFNIGAEIGIRDWLSLDLNWYRNKTNDLLVYRDLPPSGGFSQQWQNLGSVINTGFEAAMNVTPVKTRDWRWDVDFEIAYNNNWLTGFGEGVTVTKSNYSGVSQVYHDGGQLATWYLREYAGVDPQTGRNMYIDANGQKTTDYASARYIEAGSPIIPWQGGLSTALSWKNFRLSATSNFVWGNQLYGRSRASELAIWVENSLLPSNEDKIWRRPGDIATIGSPSYAPATLYHTGYLVPGNYFKIRNVTLSYTLPKSIMKNNGLTFSLSCDNAATFTTVWGGDPEVDMTGSGLIGTIQGIDDRYPNKRQYIFQVNFTF